MNKADRAPRGKGKYGLRLTDPEKEKLWTLYLSGITVKNLSSRFGLSVSAIGKYLKDRRAGAKRPARADTYSMTEALKGRFNPPEYLRKIRMDK